MKKKEIDVIEKKLIELGLAIPELAKPLAAYIPAIKSGKQILTSGQIPSAKGQLKFKGKIGKELSLEDGVKAAELCVLNCLAAVKSVAGSLDNITKIVKLTVFVNSAPGFHSQPQVANGASELLGKLFGEKGKHVRSAVGVCELPIDAAVEIEMTAELA